MKKGLFFTATLSFAVFSAIITASPVQAAFSPVSDSVISVFTPTTVQAAVIQKNLTSQAVIQNTGATNSTGTVTITGSTSTTTGTTVSTTSGTKSDAGIVVITSVQDLNEVYTTLLTAYTRSQTAITRLATKDINMKNATASLIKTATSLANAKTFLDSKIKTKLITEKAITELTLARIHLLTALSEAKIAISLASTTIPSTVNQAPLASQNTKDTE